MPPLEFFAILIASICFSGVVFIPIMGIAYLFSWIMKTSVGDAIGASVSFLFLMGLMVFLGDWLREKWRESKT